jgi:hypothetical protein
VLPAQHHLSVSSSHQLLLASLPLCGCQVVTYPGYQSLYEIAASMGCTISRWEPCYSPDTGHSFHLEDLKVSHVGIPTAY